MYTHRANIEKSQKAYLKIVYRANDQISYKANSKQINCAQE